MLSWAEHEKSFKTSGPGFNCRNKALTAKLLRQGYRSHKLYKVLRWISLHN